MTWNYLEGSEQRGPVTEADFEALVRAGKIGDDTYVWKEGMAEWQPYGVVKGPAAATAPPPIASPGQVVCAECGGSFHPDQVIRHGNVFICAACKPVFLQKLKEGVAVGGSMNYAGFGIRFGAKFLDGIIVSVVFYAISFATVGLHGVTQPGMSWMITSRLILITLGLAYATFFVGKYGATPGKMAAKLLVVNPDGSKVSYAKAAGRYFAAEFISGCFTLCIGYLMVLWDDERRALHDRICSTRVIRK
jgi:uncharacterized RDD family membrane protein YckC